MGGTPSTSGRRWTSSKGWLDADEIVPVWCEVVADTLTPVACFANVVGEGEGFLFESVEGGERWGRYSFVGRQPLATLTARGRRVETTGQLDLAPSDDGILAAVEELVTRFRSPTLPGLPPLHGGLVGISGTTWFVRSSACRRPLGRPWASRRRPGGDRTVLCLRPLASAHRPGGQRGRTR